MTPLFLLMSICFSDVTNRAGCEQTQRANIEYYHLTDYTNRAKVIVEDRVGKEYVFAASTVALTAYKKQFVFKNNQYSLASNGKEASASVTFRW